MQNAEILLTPSTTDLTNSIQITIGDQNLNSKITENSQEVKNQETPGILDASDWSEFIIGWNSNYLEVRHNGEAILGHWMDENFKIWFFGVKSR